MLEFSFSTMLFTLPLLLLLLLFLCFFGLISTCIRGILATSITILREKAFEKVVTYIMEKGLVIDFSNLIKSGICFISSSIAGERKYIWNLTANLDALDKALAGLRALREGVMSRVTKAKENPKMQRTEAVKLWFENTERVERKLAEELKDRVQEVDKLCFFGFSSKDMKSSYLFGRKVENLLQEVNTLKGQGEAFKEVAEEVTAPAREEPIDQRKIVGQDSMLEQVWRYLGDETCGTIGLYGTQGVGKTTLLKQINNRFCKERLGFQVIIMVVVSCTPNFDNIRKEIAKRIGLSGDRKFKAEDISNILCKKKFVLLLDDIWDRIELTKLGVPLQCLKSGSKIIFTTRKSDVCSKMEADEMVEAKCLSFTEASELFQQKVGKFTLESDPRIRKLADEVVKECRGLPLTLITVGKDMAGKDTPSEWEQAIKDLRTSDTEKWTRRITNSLLFGAAVWFFWDAFRGEGDDEESAEVERDGRERKGKQKIT